jgi:hypothetical protein
MACGKVFVISAALRGLFCRAASHWSVAASQAHLSHYGGTRPCDDNKKPPEGGCVFHYDIRDAQSAFSRAKPKIKATSGINAHVTLGNQNCMNDPIVMSK